MLTYSSGDEAAKTNIASNRLAAVISIFFIAVFLSCSSEESAHRDELELFNVNGVTTTVYEFESDYVKYLIKSGQNDSRENRYRFMNEMIDEILLGQKASKTGYLDHSIYQNALVYQQRKSMMDFYFMDQMNERMEPPTEEELRLAFAKKKRKVYVRHLFSRNPSELEEPFEKLENGESFVDVANEFYETSTYDSTAGYLGHVSYFGVDDAFAEAAYSTNQGEYSSPVRSQFGYHIIYVEYVEFPALLAEDEFQYRKEGLQSQVRLRNQSLISNQYVRDLMGTLDVQVDREALKGLGEVIGTLEDEWIQENRTDPEKANEFWDDGEISALADRLDPERELATYVLSGERKTFRYKDYLSWLPYLSYNESLQRIGASVGRSIRNEVLYQLASSEGYEEDPRVEERVENRGYEILADLLEYDLIQKALSDTSDVMVPDPFYDRMVTNRDIEIEANYWMIKAQSMQEARDIRKQILNESEPKDYSDYSSFENEDIDYTHPMFQLVQRALIDQPMVAKSEAFGWIVLEVEERVQNVSGNVDMSQLKEQYKVYQTISGEVQTLRSQADIQVDSLLFEDLYKIWETERSVGSTD